MTRYSQKELQILGVKVSSTTKSQVLKFVTSSLNKKSKFFITTPNPEIIVAAQKDSELKAALNAADIALPDGRGLSLAEAIGERVTGREMFEALLAHGNQKGLKVYLLGAASDVNKSAIAKIKKLYPKIMIKGRGDIEINKEGYSDSEDNKKIHIDIIRDIDDFKPDLLFVALGAPKQEKWVFHNFEKLKIGGAMVVGGALDYFVGKTTKPPAWMARAGLEWLWRAILEPRRIPRIINATVVFPALLLKERLKR